MTESTETTEQTPLVPVGVDPVDGLTVAELDQVCSQLQCDVMSALADGDDRGRGAGKRWAALALLAHRWARRTDKAAKLDTYRELHAEQLLHLLRMDDDTDAGKGLDQLDGTEANPTDCEPE